MASGRSEGANSEFPKFTPPTKTADFVWLWALHRNIPITLRQDVWTQGLVDARETEASERGVRCVSIGGKK